MIGLLTSMALLVVAQSAAPDRIVGVRVHGNHTTPDAEVLQIAQVEAGQLFTPSLPDEIQQRLDRSGRFRRAEVRKRFASISDPSAVLLVILVEERAGISVDVPDPGPMRRLKAKTMWLPLLTREDGYGFTYGARVSFVDLLGARTRASVPLTWGGERRAAVELERRFERGPISRLIGIAGISRREHPSLDIADRRTGVMVRAERTLTPSLRIAGIGAIDDVRFGVEDERLARAGVEAVLDTRQSPGFPRNAIFASATVERLAFQRSRDTMRLALDGRGFVGLFGQTVLALRALHIRTADPVPVFEQSMLGGGATLRGFSTGYRVGDRLAAGSAELRFPLSSPMKTARLGLAVFADSGTVYAAGDRLADARWDTGAGAGVFVQAPILSMRLDIARGIGAGTRAHFTLGMTF